jgi:hypothetical protein
MLEIRLPIIHSLGGKIYKVEKVKAKGRVLTGKREANGKQKCKIYSNRCKIL